MRASANAAGSHWSTVGCIAPAPACCRICWAIRRPAWPSHSGTEHGSGGRRLGRTCEDRVGVVAEQHIGAQGDGHRSFGGGPKCVAGNAKRRRLLLHTTRVSEDRTCTGLEGQKVDVPERLPATHTGCEQPAEAPRLLKRPAGPWVDRKDDRHRPLREPHERVDDPLELAGIIDIRRAMQCHQNVSVRLKPDLAPYRTDAAPPATVAGASRSSCCRHSAPVPPGCLRSQIRFSLRAMREQQCRETIGQATG